MPNSTRPLSPKIKRLPALDLARGWAILATLVVHGFIVFGVWNDLPSGARGVLRTATPTFVVLFGMMLEIVYVPRVQRVGLADVRRQTRLRSLQCYAMLMVCALASLLSGYISPKGLLATAFFAAPGGFAGILQFYSVVLLLVPTLLALRMRWGQMALLLPVAAAWLLGGLPDNLELGVLGNPAAVLLGVGQGLGPSAAQGLTFVVFGMFLGRAVVERVTTGRIERRSGAAVAAFLALAICLLVADVAGSDLRTTVVNIIENRRYRGMNHPVYYAWGVFGSVLHIGAAWLLLGTAKLQSRLGIGALGRCSLFAFTLGNVVHFLLPALREEPFVLRLSFALGSIAAVIGTTVWYEQFRARNARSAALPEYAPEVGASA